MKFLIVLAVSLACVAADVSHIDAAAPILKSDYEISPEGSYLYSYETGNGIAAEAQGIVKNLNSEYPSIDVKGGYRYISPEGLPVEISYTADENGYKPVGNLIPVSPPIPEAILRSLKYIADHPPAPAYEKAASALLG